MCSIVRQFRVKVYYGPLMILLDYRPAQMASASDRLQLDLLLKGRTAQRSHYRSVGHRRLFIQR